MTLINLKFSPDMEQAILEGMKCCTTRDENKGRIGDIFIIQDRIYRIVDIHPILFEDLVCFYWRLDGFSDPYEYKDRLKQLYNADYGYVFDVHFFAYVGEIGELWNLWGED